METVTISLYRYEGLAKNHEQLEKAIRERLPIYTGTNCLIGTSYLIPKETADEILLKKIERLEEVISENEKRISELLNDKCKMTYELAELKTRKWYQLLWKQKLSE